MKWTKSEAVGPPTPRGPPTNRHSGETNSTYVKCLPLRVVRTIAGTSCPRPAITLCGERTTESLAQCEQLRPLLSAQPLRRPALRPHPFGVVRVIFLGAPDQLPRGFLLR